MAILKFSASAVAAQIAHARACKTFLPNWNGPVDRPALILIVGNGVHLRSNGIDGTTTRIVTTEQADLPRDKQGENPASIRMRTRGCCLAGRA